MKIWNFIKNNPYIKHLLLAMGILVALSLLVLLGLNSYTRHGVAVVVPNIKGLRMEEAISFLENQGLRYEVVDSSYVKNIAPGSITETTPRAGTKVKKNRIIYIVVNAFSTQMVSVPEVTDLSQRQALAMLIAIGLKDINIEHVPGAYQELVVGLKLKGKNLSVGDKVPVNSLLTLIVSTGIEEEIFSDSVVVEETPKEETLF